MAASKINTVVAKAIVYQALKAAKAERDDKLPAIRKSFVGLSDVKKLQTLDAKRKAICTEMEALKKGILKNVPKGYSGSFGYRDYDLCITSERILFDEEDFISEIIIRGHNSEAVEEIKAFVKEKISKL